MYKLLIHAKFTAYSNMILSLFQKYYLSGKSHTENFKLIYWSRIDYTNFSYLLLFNVYMYNIEVALNIPILKNQLCYTSLHAKPIEDDLILL